MSRISDSIKEMITPGSLLCSVVYGVFGVIVAVLLLTIGFWKTLFILVFAAAGVILGAVGNKKNAVRDAVNRRFPAKDEPLKEIRTEHGDSEDIAEWVERTISHDSEQEKQE